MSIVSNSCFGFIERFILSPKATKKMTLLSPNNYGVIPIQSPPKLHLGCHSSSANLLYDKYYYYDSESNSIYTQKIKLK